MDYPIQQFLPVSSLSSLHINVDNKVSFTVDSAGPPYQAYE